MRFWLLPQQDCLLPNMQASLDTQCRDAEQVRIRHYGFLSNRGRKEKLEVVKRLIANSEHLATADEEANSPDLESAEPSTPSAQSTFAVFVVSLTAVYGCRLWADMP